MQPVILRNYLRKSFTYRQEKNLTESNQLDGTIVEREYETGYLHLERSAALVHHQYLVTKYQFQRGEITLEAYQDWLWHLKRFLLDKRLVNVRELRWHKLLEEINLYI